ncbi:MAG: hypothetical protein IJV13_06905 [Prevotella sp.]|nr:hypothetical protein [Prevotella sp.]
MKKAFISIAMLFAAGTVAVADDTMTVTLSASSEPVVFNIDQIKEIVFSEDGFTVVNLEEVATPFEFTEQTSITFDYTPDEGETTDGIGKITSTIDGEMEIFDLSGRKINKPSKGVYIIKNGNKTFKVVQK